MSGNTKVRHVSEALERVAEKAAALEHLHREAATAATAATALPPAAPAPAAAVTDEH